MTVPSKRRVRLSIDFEPDLRRQIKMAAMAAAATHLSLSEYLEAIPHQALQGDAMLERNLGPADRERSLQALAELERLD